MQHPYGFLSGAVKLYPCGADGKPVSGWWLAGRTLLLPVLAALLVIEAALSILSSIFAGGRCGLHRPVHL